MGTQAFGSIERFLSLKVNENTGMTVLNHGHGTINISLAQYD
jgi:hypothetical protein